MSIVILFYTDVSKIEVKKFNQTDGVNKL